MLLPLQTVVGMYSDEGEHFRFHQAQKAADRSQPFDLMECLTLRQKELLKTGLSPTCQYKMAL